MQKIEHFTHLKTWEVNHAATLAVYKLTRQFPPEEKYGLGDQLRRSASSVTANIAEGWGRFHFPDRRKFYYNARGSNTEVQNHLILAKDLELITQAKFNEVKLLVFRGFLLLNGLIRSLKPND